MKNPYPAIDELRRRHGRHKEIPPQYEEPVLCALHHYPELSDTRIVFTPSKDISHPLETSPAGISKMAPRGTRTYRVRILEEAEEPLKRILLHNLPHEARISAVAHELSHILQFESAKPFRAAWLNKKRRHMERELEREADVSVIEHGLGFELYTLASYTCSVPRLIEKYRHVDVNRLNPNEILEALPPDQLHDVHRF